MPEFIRRPAQGLAGGNSTPFPNGCEMISDELKAINALMVTQHATLRVVAQLVFNASSGLEEKEAGELRELLKTAIESLDEVIASTSTMIAKAGGKDSHG